MADKKISELTVVTSASINDFMLLNVDQGLDVYESSQVSVSDLADSLLSGIEYTTELETNAKTIIGAINELKAVIDNLNGV